MQGLPPTQKGKQVNKNASIGVSCLTQPSLKKWTCQTLDHLEAENPSYHQYQGLQLRSMTEDVSGEGGVSQPFGRKETNT